MKLCRGGFELFEALSVLLLGVHIAQAIQLDLTNTGTPCFPQHLLLSCCLNDGLSYLRVDELTVHFLLDRLNQGRCRYSREWYDEVLPWQRTGSDCWATSATLLLVGSRSYVWADDRILVLHWRFAIQ